MAPDVVLGLSHPVRAALHQMVWMEALVKPGLLPSVPHLEKGATAAEVRAVMDVRRYRDWLEHELFPPDETGGQ